MELNFRLPDCFPKKAIVASVPAEDLARIRDLSRSCAVIELNSGDSASFQEAFRTVVAQLVCSSPRLINNI